MTQEPMMQESMTQEAESDKISVSWKGIDVLLFLALTWGTLLVSVVISAACRSFSAADMHTPLVLLFSFLSFVVMAPLVEEFIFRLLLQGWLEAKFQQFRIPFASGIAIVMASFVFAAFHINFVSFIPRHAGYLLVSHVILSFALFTYGIIYLKRKRKVKIFRCFFGTEPFFRPRFFINAGYYLLALFFYVILCAVLFFVTGGLNFRPFTIFFLSLILGTLYSRTHNLSYCILLHAFLNGISVCLIGIGVIFSLFME
jgi:membrane protease YdiL (CAAX protease family)